MYIKVRHIFTKLLLNACNSKEEQSQINNPSSHLKNLENEEQNNPKTSRKKKKMSRNQ